MDTKTSIIALIIAGTIGGGILTGGGIEKLEMDNKNIWLTKTQYTELKTEMKTNYLKDGQIPLDQYHLMIAILNNEAKKGKFRNLTNIEKGDIIMRLVNEIEL